MSLGKANIAGLSSPQQQSEMKSILAGTWPPLKPLPVFKYETGEYRAAIEFDKIRGEWVCRKTSLPSNTVQELRGGLIEITLALPHGEAELLIEGTEVQEQELEKDTNRRLQAMHDWREKHENGARYFELRNYLSEGQRSEMDASLRLSLTARQLQCNAKNVASVFDALSTAGGRFATLMELAKRNRARQRISSQAKAEEAAALTESAAIERHERPRPWAQDEDAVERGTDADELPAVSIKSVFTEQYQAPLAERLAHARPEQCESESSGVGDAGALPLLEHSEQEGQQSPGLVGFVAQMRKSEPSEDRARGALPRFPAVEVSTLQVAIFASLFLFAVMAFTVGLTMGRGPLESHFWEATKSIRAFRSRSPETPKQTGEEISRTTTLPVASSDQSMGTNRLGAAAPSEEKVTESGRNAAPYAELRSADAHSTATNESESSSKPESKSEHRAAIGPVAGKVWSSGSSEPTHALTTGPVSSAAGSSPAHRLTSTMGAAPHLSRPATALVTVPGRGSQPFMVSFPEKAIAATSSFAMTSQLSVLISPGLGTAVAHRPARLEAGELASFIWPRYVAARDRKGLAEIIRVRATIGPAGQVLDVKFLSGSISLLPATRRAIRQWHYTPTLLDNRPVEAQQDLTIEFRPAPYSARVLHPSQNQ